MKRDELIEALKELPENIDIFSIESDDWQYDIINSYNLKIDHLSSITVLYNQPI